MSSYCLQAISPIGSSCIQSYQAGDYFGELGMLMHRKRMCSVTARTDCHMAILRRDAFFASTGLVSCRVSMRPVYRYWQSKRDFDGAASDYAEIQSMTSSEEMAAGVASITTGDDKLDANNSGSDLTCVRLHE